MTAKIRMLLADDHAVVREGIKLMVNASTDLEVVGEVTDGKEVLAAALSLLPDVVVMDLSMPGIDGIDATRALKQRLPDVAVIVFSMHEDASTLSQLFEVGASGYVLKRAVAKEFLDAVRTVAAGGVYVDPQLSRRSPIPSIPGAPQRQLSLRECDVLRAIARGYSHKEIASELDVSVKTVETYKARSMEKLGLRSRVDIVRYASDQRWLP